ncbi:MAG TPA: hypothetical protein VGY77_10575, partial [Gemmataceae bacterium]|nr:hypothetical protein [Gemmataceae bacterium]
ATGPILSDPSASKVAGPVRAAPSGRIPQEIFTVKELAAFLARPRKNTGPTEALLVNEDYDLNQEIGEDPNNRIPGLIFPGPEERDLVIGPKDPNRRATLRLKYDPQLREENREEIPVWAALTIRKGTLTLRNLRFEIDASHTQIRMAALKLLEGGRLKLENCEFVQSNPPRTDPAWMSSVVIADGRAAFRSCYFNGSDKNGKSIANSPANQEAISLDGGAAVSLEECALGPYPSFIHLRKGNGSKSTINIAKCSSILGEGSFFLADEGVASKLTIKNSLFSNPESPGAPEGLTTLIQQQGEDSMVQYEGVDNRYHNLAAFWTTTAGGATKTVAAGWNEFLAVLKTHEGTEENSQELKISSPWAEKDTLALLKKGQPELAFKANFHLTQMRQTDNPATEIVGMELSPWGRLYPVKLPPVVEKNPPALAQKIVDPTQRTGAGNYQNLKSAFGEAKAGDEILLKTNEMILIQPVELVQAADDVTLKPYPGYHPVLTLDTDNLDAAFFLLKDGKLTLEGLEFMVRPSRQSFTSLSVVAVIGDGECIIKNCVATMEEPKGISLAMVVLTIPLKVMKMESTTPRNQIPRVRIDNCFIRGQGDCVAVRAARPLELKVENTLMALTGSFLAVEGNPKESGKVDPVQVSLSHVTAFHADSLICLRSGKEGKELVPVQINPASNCVFASAAEGKALVHLEGMESAFQMKHQFSWENGRQNIYSRFQPMLDQKPKGDDMPMQPYDQQQWKKFTSETDGVFTPVKFANPPDADLSQAAGWSKTLPVHFRIKGEIPLSETGANIDNLPKPATFNSESVTGVK